MSNKEKTEARLNKILNFKEFIIEKNIAVFVSYLSMLVIMFFVLNANFEDQVANYLYIPMLIISLSSLIAYFDNKTRNKNKFLSIDNVYFYLRVFLYTTTAVIVSTLYFMNYLFIAFLMLLTIVFISYKYLSKRNQKTDHKVNKVNTQRRL